ncbi:MAG: PAS domain S-box protein, partial [Spirochaetales bacterium]|nr:PAS domain S-box protein [Spirochaetales bacterium]
LNGTYNLLILRLSSAGLHIFAFVTLIYGITFGMKAGITASIITSTIIILIGVLDVAKILPPVHTTPNYLSSAGAWLTQTSLFLLLTLSSILALGALLNGLYRYFTDLKNNAIKLKETNRRLEKEITQKELYANKLAEQKEWYRMLSENISEVIFIQDINFNITYVSPAIQAYLGYSVSEVLKLSMKDLLSRDSLKTMEDDFRRYILLAEKGESKVPLLEYEYMKKDNTRVWGELKLTFLYHAAGNVSGIQIILRDITKRKKIEQEHLAMEKNLRQSEKMQAIGQLAGGIAHDFNNQLTGILGNAELILLSHRDNPTTKKYTKEIIKSANNSSILISQLLLFARKSGMKFIITDIHNVINEVDSILSRSINKNITIIKRLNASIFIVKADPVQLLNGLLNIGINARDAMTHGGELIFSTENLVINENDVRSRLPEPLQGTCIKLSISDSGTGISQENLSRIFEPFFTTKETGTGMGLASVYGMVKTHKGHIEVKSEWGKGSVFTILLPVSKEIAHTRDKKIKIVHPDAPCHILLVDDEDIARNATKNLLEINNYTVTDFSNGTSALSYYEEHHNSIDIVILDQIMPDLSGCEVCKKMHLINPYIKCIFISGYWPDMNTIDKEHKKLWRFIQKPFSIHTLQKTINELTNA